MTRLLTISPANEFNESLVSMNSSAINDCAVARARPRSAALRIVLNDPTISLACPLVKHPAGEAVLVAAAAPAAATVSVYALVMVVAANVVVSTLVTVVVRGSAPTVTVAPTSVQRLDINISRYAAHVMPVSVSVVTNRVVTKCLPTILKFGYKDDPTTLSLPQDTHTLLIRLPSRRMSPSPLSLTLSGFLPRVSHVRNTVRSDI